MNVVDLRLSAPAWWPDWREQTCVIIASGPSAATAGVEEAQGCARVIAINNSWQLAPWADVLYGCDSVWWADHNGVPEFKGLKISQDPDACKAYPEIKRVETNRKSEDILMAKAGQIGWGGNGGFHSINIAAQFGPPRKLILVGFDMRIDRGMHWHGKHKGNNPIEKNIKRWRQSIDNAARTLEALGIEVINASPISTLTAYRKMSLKEALA